MCPNCDAMARTLRRPLDLAVLCVMAAQEFGGRRLGRIMEGDVQLKKTQAQPRLTCFWYTKQIPVLMS